MSDSSFASSHLPLPANIQYALFNSHSDNRQLILTGFQGLHCNFQETRILIRSGAVLEYTAYSVLFPLPSLNRQRFMKLWVFTNVSLFQQKEKPILEITLCLYLIYLFCCNIYHHQLQVEQSAGRCQLVLKGISSHNSLRNRLIYFHSQGTCYAEFKENVLCLVLVLRKRSAEVGVLLIDTLHAYPRRQPIDTLHASNLIDNGDHFVSYGLTV